MAGGKLLQELETSSPGFREWAIEAVRSGTMRIVNKDEVGARAKNIHAGGVCESNDAHVLALAQVSGARLLYSNDQTLQRDFKNSKLIKNPRGNVYTTLRNKNVAPSHRRLLGRTNICRT